jgi:hypothetical protein
MSEDNKRSSEKPAAAGNRKPYAKPNVTSELIYETLALACGKLAGQGGSCNAVPRRS